MTMFDQNEAPLSDYGRGQRDAIDAVIKYLDTMATRDRACRCPACLAVTELVDQEWEDVDRGILLTRLAQFGTEEIGQHFWEWYRPEEDNQTETRADVFAGLQSKHAGLPVLDLEDTGRWRGEWANE
jgi:hypothetical protein